VSVCENNGAAGGNGMEDPQVYDYWLREIRPEELLVSFGDETISVPFK
jgi:hypothetical protein